jgi:hypothetical protein
MTHAAIRGCASIHRQSQPRMVEEAYMILPICTAIILGAVAWLFWLRRDIR